MKKYFVSWLICVLVLSLTGCDRMASAYSCEIMDLTSRENIQKISSAPLQVLDVGQSTFTVKLSAKVEAEDHERYDVYSVVDAFGETTNQQIRIHADTGELVGFSGINPYAKIDHIESLTDEELKTILETLLIDTDFSVYNTFSVLRPSSPAGQYVICWQVKTEVLRNIRMDVSITSDGFVNGYAKVNNCPEDLVKPFLSQTDQARLIEDRLCKHLDLKAIESIEYKILSETLSSYRGKDALLYTIEVVDDGFSQIVLLVIS